MSILVRGLFHNPNQDLEVEVNLIKKRVPEKLKDISRNQNLNLKAINYKSLTHKNHLNHLNLKENKVNVKDHTIKKIINNSEI